MKMTIAQVEILPTRLSYLSLWRILICIEIYDHMCTIQRNFVSETEIVSLRTLGKEGM